MWQLTPRPGSSGVRRTGIWTAIGGAASDVLLCRCWERLPPSATFTDGREGSIKSHKEFDCESTTPNFLHLIHNLSLSLYSRSVIYSRRYQTHCFPILKGVAPRRADLVSACCKVRWFCPLEITPKAHTTSNHKMPAFESPEQPATAASTTAAADSNVDFPPVTRDHILHCSYDYWFPK